MDLAPILLFVYNRPYHTEQTVEALQRNELAKRSTLIIYSDGPKDNDAIQDVNRIRIFIKSIKGFADIKIVEREKNLGLAESIIDGVGRTISEYGRVIVLEDDLLTSPYFLTYMNKGLEKYEYDERVVSIHGYVLPVTSNLPETFFLRGADCWGWATWARGWKLFNEDGHDLLNKLEQEKLLKAFNFNGCYPYSKMLKAQIRGANDSWAIRWHASAFLANKLTLYPGMSLVHNIGNDGSGTHSAESTGLDARMTERPINLETIIVNPSREAQEVLEVFLKSKKNNILKTVWPSTRRFSRKLLGR